MLFHQQVFLAHIVAVKVFVGAEFVFDDFEHIRKRRQGKHQHHQAFDARREREGVVGIVQMAREFAVKNVFALFLQTEQGVQIAFGAHGQHGVQKFHIRRRHFHLHQKIRTGK